jgi:L-ribulose-5-phosphate 3-epimerase
MYRTAIITDEISQDIRVAAGLAREYHLDAIEIRSVDERNPFQMSLEDAGGIKRIADEHGLDICCVASPLYKISATDHVGRKEHLDALRRCAEYMHLWDCKLIRGFAFLHENANEPNLQEAADAYELPVRIAEDADLTFVIESEPSVRTGNILQLERFLKLVNEPRVMALYDPGNEASDFNAPPAYPDGYERIRKWIRHVHIKDIKGSSKTFSPVLIGEGSVDFNHLIPRLKKDFDGYCSVETHYRIKASLSEEDIVHPQGSSFSQGGYEASKAYLDRLEHRLHWREET